MKQQLQQQSSCPLTAIMPQGGRPAPKKPAAQPRKGQPPSAEGKSTSAPWQRSSGGFSGAAKKEYLKWKRQQKAAHAEDASTDDETSPALQQSGAQPSASTASAVPGRSRPPAQLETATQPLQYRPLTAVPATPFTMAPLTPTTQPQCDIQGTPAVDDADCIGGSAPQIQHMPRLVPTEVGFTTGGFALDMPTRPKWQVCKIAA